MTNRNPLVKATVVVFVALSCHSAGAQSVSEPMDTRLNELVQQRMKKEIQRAERDANTQPISEARAAVTLVRKAVTALEHKNLGEANVALENAMGKLQLVSARHPHLALAPISTDVRVIDPTEDEETIKKTKKEIKKLIDEDQMQAARKLVRSLASEIDIVMTNMPIATYLKAIQNATQMLKKNQVTSAKTELLTALDSLVITETMIPLPIVKAAALVDEVNTQIQQKNVKKEESVALLEKAEKQLTLAQELGYAVNKEQIASLKSSLEQLTSEIEDNKINPDLVARLRTDLEAVRQKLNATT